MIDGNSQIDEEALDHLLRDYGRSGGLRPAAVGPDATMSAEGVFVAIIVFTGGLLVGYTSGWRDGVQRGFSSGWSHAMTEVRRLIARTKGSPS